MVTRKAKKEVTKGTVAAERQVMGSAAPAFVKYLCAAKDTEDIFFLVGSD